MFVVMRPDAIEVFLDRLTAADLEGHLSWGDESCGMGPDGRFVDSEIRTAIGTMAIVVPPHVRRAMLHSAS